MTRIRHIQERAIKEWAKGQLTAETLALIGAANSDLYGGPGDVADDENYPGFSRACRSISEALPHSDLWVSLDGTVSEHEPEWHDEQGEPQESAEDWTLFSSGTIKRVIVGSELASYV